MTSERLHDREGAPRLQAEIRVTAECVKSSGATTKTRAKRAEGGAWCRSGSDVRRGHGLNAWGGGAG